MKKLVIDSSIIVKWLNQQDEERVSQADVILNHAQDKGNILLAPELAKYEIGNALLMKKQLSQEDAVITFNAFFTLPIQFVSQSKNLSVETYRIARAEKITFYDACFIALAKQEGADLVTDNPKHQAKTKEVKVIPLSEYR